MIYHLIVATGGVAALLLVWWSVQTLHRRFFEASGGETMGPGATCGSCSQAGECTVHGPVHGADPARHEHEPMPPDDLIGDGSGSHIPPPAPLPAAVGCFVEKNDSPISKTSTPTRDGA